MNGQNIKFFVLGAAMVAASFSALAVNIPNSFSAGQVISATAMNANFAALKAAIDALESGLPNKQHRVSGTCAVGQTIRSINADGTVVCGGATFRAAINTDGTVYDPQSSGGISSSKVSAGWYDVVFPRSVLGCSRMAQWTGGGTPKIISTAAGSQVGKSNETVRVTVTDTSGSYVNDFFVLLVVCD